jgi:hypothetical protein
MDSKAEQGISNGDAGSKSNDAAAEEPPKDSTPEEKKINVALFYVS